MATAGQRAGHKAATEINAKINRLILALEQIADRAKDNPAPEPEDYDDTESAYSNGADVGTYEERLTCANIAREALGLKPLQSRI